MKLVAINVHTSNERSDLVLGFLRKADADVVLLMEINTRWLEALDSLHTNYPFVIAEPREDNFGIALFSRLPLRNDSVIRFGSVQLPSIATDIPLGTTMIRLVETHPLPPGSSVYSRLRDEQLQQVAVYARKQTIPIVVAGDLNATPWSPCFKDLLRIGGLKNTSQGRGLFASWPAWLPAGRIPLDHCLVSPSFTVVDKRLGPNVGSDHLPVVVELELADDTASADAR